MNTKGRNDLVIHNGKDAKSNVGVIIETKSPSNKADIEIISQKQISDLVKLILKLKFDNMSSDTSNLEAEIDQLVYAFYGLTDEEIAIVEGS